MAIKKLTKEGLKKLQEELDYLKNVRRKEIVKRIREAAALGDLKENAGYHAAKEDQAFTEGKIKSLTDIVNQAEVIEKKGDQIQPGSLVCLESKDGKEKYQVVEPEEADIMSGKISTESSLGKALLGKKKGDSVDFETPGGLRKFKITKVD